MEENVVLKVVLHPNEGLEIMVGGAGNVNPLMLIGILEQVKMNILNESSHTEEMDPGMKGPVKNQA